MLLRIVTSANYLKGIYHMKQQGFTLIELLIVIVIIGIISAIAYPNYTQHLLKSKRSEAQSALIDIARHQELYYLDQKRYTTNLTDLGYNNPFITENNYYSIEASSSLVTANFVLIATAINTQVNDVDCVQLSISHDLNKSATSEKCWR